MISKILFIRHGITEGNARRWYYGATDIPLLEEGIEALSKLRDSGIYPASDKASFYTSGMLRTEQTLETIYGDVPHGVLPLFREMNFGEWECRTFDSLKSEPLFDTWVNDTTGTIAYPGGDSIESFKARVIEGVKVLMELHGNENPETIVVCHGGVIAGIMEHCFLNERESFWHWIPEPGHGYSLTLDGDEVTGYDSF